MLIGNKVDKPDKVISYEMGAEYAREKNWGFMEVSAKADINIKSAFQTLVQNIFQVKTRDQQTIQSNTELPIGENRAASISLHGQQQQRTSGKKKKDKGCCK